MDGVCLEPDDDDVVISVKAVPGASRDQIAGLIGDRLKVRVSAPPEGGGANRSICRLIAAALDIKPARVTVESGHASPRKTIRVQAMEMDEVRMRLGLD